MPEAIGMAESAVKSAKNILKKAKESNTDIYQALLDHRNMPRMATGLSPAQVLYQHPIRTATVPHHSPPTAQEQQACQHKARRQEQIRKSHDKSAKHLPPLEKETKVWFKEWKGEKEIWSKGTISDVDPLERSYIVKTDHGTFRRNRIYIRPDHTDDINTDNDDEDTSPVKPPGRPQQHQARAEHGYGYIPPTATRYGSDY